MRDGLKPRVGLSLMLEEDFRLAAGPLFAEDAVEILEWSFDTAFTRARPAWAEALLDVYGSGGALLGHGVHFSPLSGTWEPRQETWLTRFREETDRRPYARVSEHYGFMTTPTFVRGAPLPPPRSRAALEVGRDRLARLREASGVPVGLENLALAWNRDEALAQGAWLEALLAPDGFLVLDVHNLGCQIRNFGLDAAEALESFPCARVREIHVSGGSDLPAWPGSPSTVRCDTHDDRVPDDVFALLGHALARCENVDAVIFERLGGTVRGEDDAAALRDDFARVRSIVAETRLGSIDVAPVASSEPAFDDDVERYAAMQTALLRVLHATDEASAVARIAAAGALDPYRALFEAADPRALGVASRVTKKYARLARA